MMNIYKRAIKQKIRFDYKGMQTTEDIDQLNVEDLNDIYVALVKQKKDTEVEGLLITKTKEDSLLNLKIAIIKDIVETKLAEKDARLLLADKKEKKEKIMTILASKEDDALEKKSPVALKKMLDEL